MRSVRLIKKFLMIPPLALPSSVRCASNIEVIKKPLSTKNRKTPPPPSGISTSFINRPLGTVSSNHTPLCCINTKNTAKALRVSRPFICFKKIVLWVKIRFYVNEDSCTPSTPRFFQIVLLKLIQKVTIAVRDR